MRVGVIFPQTEIGADPAAVRDFAQAAEELGYDHLLTYEHVLGVDTQHYQGWSGPYDHEDMFHEPFVLFGYLAGITRRIELVTGVLVLPQRQTVLVAKQAAAVDVLSGGRLRLGVGIGWNWVEYEALGENFRNRGRRAEEQVALLRALWTEEVVNFQGRWHKVTNAGVNPLPVQRPIPLWMGGRAEPAVQRIARIADGWLPQFRPDTAGKESIARFRQYVQEGGRDPAKIGIDGRIPVAGGNPESWAIEAKEWEELGATHVSLNTMGAGLSSPSQHIDAIRRFKESVGG